ncbi:leucine-rich repeat domain-containing protein, partial [Enterococcus faecium]|uniref:leucine-rich repeat domain-containing protein n=1 Tax=Enterococcus faecium TaxID=1352 RepID=UPI003392C35C
GTNEASEKQEVDMPDAALKAAVNAELNKEKIDGKTDRAATDPVYDTELAQMKSICLNANVGVTNLKGLEKATKLEQLDLSSYVTGISKNNITNIDAIEHLTNLKELSMGVGVKKISDLSKLASLSNLEYLYISSADVEDISALSHLTNLRVLNIKNTKVHDISAISGLTKLVDLRLRENHIRDFTPLKDIMGNLTSFNAQGQIFNEKKRDVVELQVQLAPITLIMPDGTEVSTPTSLNSGVFQDGKVIFNASKPIERNLIYAIDGVGAYSAISAIVTQPLNFTHKQEVNMPDAALKAAVNAELNKEKIDGKTDRAATDPVYDTELAQMHMLICESKGIGTLKGLEHAVNLTRLDVSYNKLNQESVQYIAPLVNLTYLAIDQSNENSTSEKDVITDISSLKDLVNLEDFYLSGNKVADISVMKNMPKLKLLKLRANKVTDFEPLKELIASGILTELDAKRQKIEAEKQEVVGDKVVVKPIELILPDGTKLTDASNISDNGHFEEDNIVVPWTSDKDQNITYTLTTGDSATISADVTQPVKFTYKLDAKVDTYHYGDKYITCTAGSNITSFRYTVEQADGTTKTYTVRGLKEGETWKIYVAPGVIMPDTKSVTLYGLKDNKVVIKENVSFSVAENSRLQLNDYAYGDKYITCTAGSNITAFKYTVEQADGTKKTYMSAGNKTADGTWQIYVALGVITPNTKKVVVCGLSKGVVVDQKELVVKTS